MEASASAPAAADPAPAGRLTNTAVSVVSGACVLTAAQAGPLALVTTIGYAALGAVAPDVALLLVAAGAGLAPTLCSAFIHWPARLAQILPIAALCGIHARASIRGFQRASPTVRWAVAVVLAVLVASVAVQLAISAVVLSKNGVVAGLDELAHTFLDGSRTFSYLVAGVQFATCVGLYQAAAVISRTPEKTARLVRMLIVGGAAVASLNLARVFEIVLRSGVPIPKAVDALAHVRVAVTNGDPNALGSLFAMLATLAFVRMKHERGALRIGLATGGLVIAAGLWTTGSRTALGVLLFAALAAAVWTWRANWRTWITGAAIAGAVAAAVIAFPNSLVDRSSVVGAADIRGEMARVAIRLWETDPLLGVGVGQFFARSGEFIRDPYVRQLYGRENAHNNFLQIVAELGIVGAVACALLMIATFWSSPPAGLRPALAVFLATCLAGHPLLVPDVAFAFALTAGAAAAYARSSLSLPFKVVAGAVLLTTVAAVPVSYRAERSAANLDHLGYGVSDWQVSSDGLRFRRSDGDATIFVPSAATEVLIEIKREVEAPITVQIALDGRPADTVTIAEAGWFRYRLMMPPRRREAFLALRFRATDRSGAPAAFDLAKITPMP